MTFSYTYNRTPQMSDAEIYQLQVAKEEATHLERCCAYCLNYDGVEVEGAKVSGTTKLGEEFEGYLCDQHINDNFHKDEYYFI